MKKHEETNNEEYKPNNEVIRKTLKRCFDFGLIFMNIWSWQFSNNSQNDCA